MVWTAKWRLVSVEGGEAYHTAIHTPEAFREKLRLLHAELKVNPDCYIEELTVDKAEGIIHRIVYIKGEKKRDSGRVKLNHEFEHTIPDGRLVKAKITLEGDDKLICVEKGPDFEAHGTLHLHGDEITATQTSGGVTCTEKFKRVA